MAAERLERLHSKMLVQQLGGFLAIEQGRGAFADSDALKLRAQPVHGGVRIRNEHFPRLQSSQLVQEVLIRSPLFDDPKVARRRVERRQSPARPSSSALSPRNGGEEA